MKNPFKKLSQEAKGALLVSLVSVFFFSALAGIGIAINASQSTDVGGIVATTSTPNSTSLPSTSSNDDTVNNKVYAIKKPVNEDCSYLHYFFDISYDIDDDRLNKALLEFEGKTHQSRGVDFAKNDDSSFEIYSSYPCKVISITPSDRVYGGIVKAISDDGLTFIYAGLSKIDVKVDQVLDQDDKIGTSGATAFSGSNQNILHYEIIKDGQYLNPESSFDKTIDQL